MEIMANSNFSFLGEEILKDINGGVNWYEIGLGTLSIADAVGGLIAAPEITIPVLIAYYTGLGTGLDLYYHSTGR